MGITVIVNISGEAHGSGIEDFQMEKKNKYLKMTFGVHKGKPLNKLPTSYLEWLEKEKIFKNIEYRYQISVLLDKRKEEESLQEQTIEF